MIDFPLKVSDVANVLSEELGIVVTNNRVREYCDLIDVPRHEDNDYREVDEKSFKLLRLITVFRELNVPQDEIVAFIKNKFTMPDFIKLTEIVHAYKFNLVPKAEDILGEYAFDSIDS